MQVGQFIEHFGGNSCGGVYRGEVGAYFSSEFGLHFWVLAEVEDRPRYRCGGGFMAGGEEGHQLVNEIVFREAAGLKSNSQDVGVDRFLGLEFTLLGLDQFAAHFADRLRGCDYVGVALDGNHSDDEEGNEEAQDAEDSRLRVGRKYCAVCCVQLGIWVLKGSKVLSHACDPNYIQCHSASPVRDFNDSDRFALLLFRIGCSCLCNLTDAFDHLDRFSPKNRVQVFDVAKGEGWHEVLALPL